MSSSPVRLRLGKLAVKLVGRRQRLDSQLTSFGGLGSVGQRAKTSAIQVAQPAQIKKVVCFQGTLAVQSSSTKVKPEHYQLDNVLQLVSLHFS